MTLSMNHPDDSQHFRWPSVSGDSETGGQVIRQMNSRTCLLFGAPGCTWQAMER
jgi:hypothetical protein